MDSSAGGLPAPVSIRHGPITDADSMDVDGPQVNGSGKRKSRTSHVSYKDDSDSDDAPIVRAEVIDYGFCTLCTHRSS
jgi:DNA topoisomerase I